MCGIAGIHRRGNKQIPQVNTLADYLLLGIEDRGQDATGFMAMLASGKVQVEKAAVPAGKFVLGRKAISAAARSVLLHTRWATVGNARDPRNAHPVISGKCAAVHNGTIYNHREVFTAFKLPRKAEVDSEVIPAIIDYAGWDKAADAFSLLEGGMATAVVNADNPKEVILARLTTYPLEILVTTDLVVWASTRRAIEIAWQKTYGRKPRGRWITMKPYTMIRVNGKVEAEVEIARPTPPVKSAKSRRTYAGGSPVSKRARKRARRVASQPRTKAYTPATDTFDDLFDEEPYVTQAVKDLQRAGYDYASAHEMVFGFSPDEEPDDYLETTYAAPRRTGFFWEDEYREDDEDA